MTVSGSINPFVEEVWVAVVSGMALAVKPAVLHVAVSPSLQKTH